MLWGQRPHSPVVTLRSPPFLLADDEGSQLQDVAALAVGAQAFEVVNGNRNHAGPSGDGDASLDEMAHEVVMAGRAN